jgi:peroxiredoxin (alkyl hydroperoxide reductase subunit C)
MAAIVGAPAPQFFGQAYHNGEFKEVKLSDFKGKKVVLFFYPLDFTFVCPTEILAFSDALDEFEKRNTVVLAASVDSHFSHYGWAQMPRSKGGIEGVRYPILSDLDKKISRDYGVLKEGFEVALRGLFIVNKEGVLKHATINDLDLGRNVDEVLRVLDAIDYTEEHGEVCPANWKKGEKAMKPTFEGLEEYASSR